MIQPANIEIGSDYKEKYGFSVPEDYVFKAKRGLSEEVVREISWMKKEPEWMLKNRLRALSIFRKKPMPNWGADLSVIDFENIFYYLRATDRQSKTWEDLPSDIKATYDKLGVPEAERNFLAGVSAQYECLAKGTQVWTEVGTKAIENITIGDKVWGYDEEKRTVGLHRVLGIQAKGVKDVYKVETTGRTLECTKNHPFLYTNRTREGKLEWRYLSDLRVGDYVVTARKRPEEGVLRPVSGSGLPTELGTEKIKKVDWNGLSQTYDIEVEGVRNFIANGVVVHNSEVVYHSLQKELASKGVIFCDTDTALREHEELVKEYFGTIIPAADNKFAALNTAVWSGGSFLYIPKGVRVDVPMQAYFRINAENMGQFERTLIICEEDSFSSYFEGCSAPIYSTDSLHSAVVEIIVKKGARFRYTTIQNWSTNVFNLVTKRAVAYADSTMEWVDGNIGSRITQKYPSVYLMEPGAKGDVLSVAFAGKGQRQDAGGKMIHVASNTTGTITSKSISKDGGRTTYRGHVKIYPGARNCKSFVKCDALLLDEDSRSDTYPYNDVEGENATLGHEATVSKISDEQIFYLMSRGITRAEAETMIINGFIEPFTKELPVEYAVEMNRLIQLEMSGSVG